MAITLLKISDPLLERTVKTEQLCNGPRHSPRAESPMENGIIWNSTQTDGGMNDQSSKRDRTVVVNDDSADEKAFVTVQVINELREKISDLQCELQHLKRKKTAPIDSLYQQGLNKIESDMKNFSNTIQSTDGFFKNFDKDNTEVSNELTALKRKVNKRFDEEKDLGERKYELSDEGMAELQNRTEKLDTEIKHIRDGLKDEHEQVRASIQSTKDLFKSYDQRITETSNEVKALKESISNGLLVRTEASDDGSFVKNDDLPKHRNGVLNFYSKGIQEEPERSKQLSNEIKNVESVAQSKNSLENQCKDMNEKLTVMGNSIKQFSMEIQKLQTELKAEQQKNIVSENKLMALECYLEETLINDIKQISNKEISIYETPVPNTSPKESDFVAKTNKLKISESETKKLGQMDMQSNLLTHDFQWTDIVSKGHNDVNFSEEVKRKYVRQGINQLDNNKQECRSCLPQTAEAFYEKESSTSAVYSQTNDLNENQCAGLAFNSSSGKNGDLSYLEKAHAYLQNLQMEGMLTFSDVESLAVSNDGSSVPLEPEIDTKKLCGEGKKKKKRSRETKVERGDIILSDKIEWAIRHTVTPREDSSYQSRVFYTGTPGYRLQLLAKIDPPEGEVFFCLRVLKGVYDEKLKWPCQQGISIKVSKKMQSDGVEYLIIPEKDVLTKPESKSDKVFTKWLGPLNIGHYLDNKKIVFDIYLA